MKDTESFTKINKKIAIHVTMSFKCGEPNPDKKLKDIKDTRTDLIDYPDIRASHIGIHKRTNK